MVSKDQVKGGAGGIGGGGGGVAFWPHEEKQGQCKK